MLGTLVPDFMITGISPEGRAYGMVGDIKVFVEKGIPGDVADIAMIKSYRGQKTLATGKIIGLKKNSPLRIAPFCKHFTDCGGCQWQNIPYAAQLEFKQKQVEELLKEASRSAFIMQPIIPSQSETHFRNRVTFTFSNRRWMSPEELALPQPDKRPAAGFVLKGNNDRIINIDECFLADPLAVGMMKALREFSLSQGHSFYDARHEEGFLRSLTVRFGDQGEIMVIVAFGQDHQDDIERIMQFMQSEFPMVTSSYYVIRRWKDALKGNPRPVHFSGKAHLAYRMDDLEFHVGPDSFYQTNSRQAHELYNVARDFASLTGKETVYDLYCGTGTIGLFVARLAGKVIGIDNVSSSIEDAAANARLNSISNASFFAGDLKDVLNETFFEQNGRPDVVITDPPRSGMHRDGIRQLLGSGAKRIVYISCNPLTQARDIRNLSSKYRLVKSRAIDMFPQTSHVENVALLTIE